MSASGRVFGASTMTLVGQSHIPESSQKYPPSLLGKIGTVGLSGRKDCYRRYARVKIQRLSKTGSISAGCESSTSALRSMYLPRHSNHSRVLIVSPCSHKCRPTCSKSERATNLGFCLAITLQTALVRALHVAVIALDLLTSTILDQCLTNAAARAARLAGVDRGRVVVSGHVEVVRNEMRSRS